MSSTMCGDPRARLPSGAAWAHARRRDTPAAARAHLAGAAAPQRLRAAAMPGRCERRIPCPSALRLSSAVPCSGSRCIRRHGRNAVAVTAGRHAAPPRRARDQTRCASACSSAGPPGCGLRCSAGLPAVLLTEASRLGAGVPRREPCAGLWRCPGCGAESVWLALFRGCLSAENSRQLLPQPKSATSRARKHPDAAAGRRMAAGYCVAEHVSRTLASARCWRSMVLQHSTGATSQRRSAARRRQQQRGSPCCSG
jgi:hypothetical protein